MTTYTIQVTYQVVFDSGAGRDCCEREEWIEDNIYQSVDLGLPTKADIVDLVIE